MKREKYWTPARVTRLKLMAEMGHSAAVIATSLGGTTRNAVIGKLWRLGYGCPKEGDKRYGPGHHEKTAYRKPSNARYLAHRAA